MINNHSVVAKNHPPSVPSSISVLHISIKVKILSFGPFLRSRWLRISPLCIWEEYYLEFDIGYPGKII